MSTRVAVAAFVSSCIAGVFLTWLVRRYALRRQMLDIPNARSSHSAPVPRGGGLSIAIVVLSGLMAGLVAGLVDRRFTLALTGGGAMVALVGWTDDHRHVPAWARTLVHATAAMWAIWMLEGIESVRILGVDIALGFAGSVLAIFYIVWMINLYNFMDGIDGIAGCEATVVALAGAALLWYTGAHALAFCALVAAGTATGFLVWNWSPAKIFMGDVGSGFLGFVFGTLSIASDIRGSLGISVWLLLLGVFVFDATVTLLRRVLHGERWYTAHRRHAYQRAVQSGRSHARVTATVVLIGVSLALLATIAVALPEYEGAAVLVGIGVLVVAYAMVERARPMYP